jgi:hypothetical protein
MFKMIITLFYLSILGTSLCYITQPLKNKLNSKAKFALISEDIPGQTAPFGFFDPLGLSSGISDRQFRRWQEAELKHGRICMLVCFPFYPFTFSYIV